MTASHPSDTEDNDEMSEASLFDAIAHETRIRALFLLQDGALSFSELKREMGIASSGNLQHHITKMDSLLEVNADGLYSLTDNGREALLAIQSIRTMQDRIWSRMKVLIVVGTLILYAIEMTTPFLLGTVGPLTPLDAVVGSVSFGVILYVLYSAWFKLVMDKKSESSIWFKKAKHSAFLKD